MDDVRLCNYFCYVIDYTSLAVNVNEGVCTGITIALIYQFSSKK